MTSLPQINARLFGRYLEIIRSAGDQPDPFDSDPRLSLKNLSWMCTAGQSDAFSMAEDKASRWLGFVQGCLAMRGMIDVDVERDITRPLFHSLVKARTGQVPETLERDT